MGQPEVRAAVISYLRNQAFSHVVQIFQAVPSFFPEVEWVTTAQDQWTAMLAFNIEQFTETRMSMPAAGNSGGGPVGTKMRTYQCSILVHQQYWIPEFYPPGEDAASYVSMIDTLVEDIVSAIHADPTLGSAGKPIFQAGQADQGITTYQEVPQYNSDQSGIYAWTRIAFTIDEVIQA
jgi:hypothetical protein